MIDEKRQKYTKEQDLWLLDTITKYGNLKLVADEFNIKFNKNKTALNIQAHLRKLGVRLTHKFTEEQIIFIKDNFYDFETTKKLLIYFNEHFKMDLTYTSLVGKCYRMGLKRYTVSQDNLSKYRSKYEKDVQIINSKDETSWLKNNHNKFTNTNSLKDEFNRYFNKNLSLSTIRNKIYKLKLNTSHVYTKEETNFIIEKAILGLSPVKAFKDFVERFGKIVSKKSFDAKYLYERKIIDKAKGV